MTTVAQLSQTLRIRLTTTAEALGRSSGFVQRRSKLMGAAFAQTLVFGFLADAGATLEERAQTAAAAGVGISPQGLDQRCTEGAAVFLEQLLGAAVLEVVSGDPVAIPLLARFSAVLLVDSSTLVLPGALAVWWPGCGGSSPATTAAALKLHVRYDLCAGALGGPLLTDGRTHESTTTLQTAPLPPGALRVADLGFFALDVLARLADRGGYWLSRLHRTTAVYDAAGRRWEVLALLAAQGTDTVDLPVTLGARHRMPARLLAVRVPPEVAAQRRRARTEARAKGQTASAAALAWCDWTILATNTPTSLLSLREALVLLRARWQVELLFKLWKSQGRIDESRSRKPWRVLCEVLAKLLAMLVQHWLLVTGCWAYPHRSLMKAAHTIRQHALHLACALACPALLARAIAIIHRCLAAGCRLNRRKQHPNTSQFFLDPSLQPLA